MQKFTSFVEGKTPEISGGYNYDDKAHPQHKAVKAVAYEAKEALKRRGVTVHDHEAFIRDMHKLLKKHSTVGSL